MLNRRGTGRGGIRGKGGIRPDLKDCVSQQTELMRGGGGKDLKGKRRNTFGKLNFTI